MIDKNTLTEEQLINISAALRVQDALINEVYPEMRRVIGCLNHIKKLYRLLVICEGEITDDFYWNMDAVFAESLLGVPDNYNVDLIVKRIDFPSFYQSDFNGNEWYFFTPFARHEEIKVDTDHKVTIKLE